MVSRGGAIGTKNTDARRELAVNEGAPPRAVTVLAQATLRRCLVIEKAPVGHFREVRSAGGDADLAHRTPIVVADQLTSDIGRVGHGRQMVGSTREDGTIEELVTRRRKGVCGLEGRGGIINADGNVGSVRKFLAEYVAPGIRRDVA